MKKRSFIRNLSIMLFMQFVLLTALFVALIVHMRNSAVTEMETAADNVLAIYRVNLENRIERANNILKNLTLSEETALEMIRSDKESDRYYAKKSIYTAMHAALLQDNAVDLLIVAENSYGGYMESTNGDSSKWALPYETRKAVESFTWELLGSGTRKNSWTIQEIAGEPFLYRAYMRNGHIVAAYISVQNFFSSNTDPAISSLCLALTDSNGYVWKTIGSELKNIPLGQTMQALGSNWKVNQLEIGDSSLYVTSYLNEYGITYTTQTSVLSVILIAIVALGCSAAIIFYTRRQIIKPMKDMTEKLHDMNGVTEGFQIQTSYGSQEFLVLRDTFNRMMRENVDLRLSAYKHHFASWIMDAVPFFSTLKRGNKVLPEAPALDTPKKRWVYWVGYVLNMLLPAALAMPVMHYWVGKQSFAPMTVTKWFGEGTTTEIAAWALVASACILAVFLLSYFLFSRKYGMSTEGWGYKTSAPNFFKSLLLAFMTFLTAYAFVFIADFFFVTDFRFWLIAMRTFNANKVMYWLAYLPAFAVFYLVNSLVVEGGNRIKGMPEWAVTTLSCLANFLGLAILISIQYIVYAQTGTFVFNAMRTHNLFPFLVQVPVATLITRRYFKETGSIYLGSFTIAMLYTMMQVTQVSTNLGLIP